jgi:hypothetical protein
MKRFVKLLRACSTSLLLFVTALPLVSACSSAEPPKTPEQIEESRAKHQEISRKEWEG